MQLRDCLLITYTDAIKELIYHIMTHPILIHLDPTKTFKLEVNASNYTTGTILFQRDDKGKSCPIRYTVPRIRAWVLMKPTRRWWAWWSKGWTRECGLQGNCGVPTDLQQTQSLWRHWCCRLEEWGMELHLCVLRHRVLSWGGG
jgi:hypothetical protein